jgi:hypothetical protein
VAGDDEGDGDGSGLGEGDGDGDAGGEGSELGEGDGDATGDALGAAPGDAPAPDEAIPGEPLGDPLEPLGDPLDPHPARSAAMSSRAMPATLKAFMEGAREGGRSRIGSVVRGQVPAASASATSVCASSRIRSRWASPRKLSA